MTFELEAQTWSERTRSTMPRKGFPPVIIGHRGHAESLENTLVSFRESIEMGAEMLELDVRLSKDLVPMVSHDSTLKRVTGGKPGRVAARTSKHLLSMDLGKGHRFTTLEAALKELTPLVPINIELKFNRPEYRPLVDAVCKVVDDLGVAQRVLVSSFFHGALALTKRKLPGISVAPLFGTLTGRPHKDDLRELFARSRQTHVLADYPFHGRAAVVSWKMIDEDLFARFEKGGGSLLTYTVDDPEEMRRLIGHGIDGIITNRPAILRRVIEELFPRTPREH